MKTRILNIFKSFVIAFAAMLSLSCCGVGDEILIDEIETETATEAVETTTSETTEELTTPEITTEETTETTTDETEEATTEETTLTIPDEETILASLSDEEKEVWLSMPDIVTMRMLVRLDNNDDEILYTEIIYIDKIGQVKKFISYDELKTNNDEETIEWLNDKISRNEDAELINAADIHTLIKFYNTLTCIDPNSKLQHWCGWHPSVYIERHYWFEIFGVRSDGGKNSYEALEISSGDAGEYSIQHNYIDKYDRHGVLERKDIDTYGRDTFNLYLELDPFMVPDPGEQGYLIGEEG